MVIANRFQYYDVQHFLLLKSVFHLKYVLDFLHKKWKKNEIVHKFQLVFFDEIDQIKER